MKKYFILAAAAAMFAACSNDNDPSQGETQNERTPLKIGAAYSASGTMRSSTIGLQDNAAVDMTGNTAGIGFYILESGKTTTQTGAADYEQFNIASTSLTVNTPSTNYTKVAFSNTLYYPNDKTQGIDIYAYSPYSASAPNNTKDISSDLLTLTTSATQTYDANYYANDFLWGCVGSGTTSAAQTRAGSGSSASITAANYKTATTSSATGFVSGTGEVIVPMVHLGSKIIVKVVTDGSLNVSNLAGATVKFYADYMTGDLKISEGSVTLGSKTAHTAITLGKLGYSDNSTVIAASEGDANGTKGVVGDGTNITGYTCAGVILPQMIDATSTSLIEIILSNGTTYAYSPSASHTFAEAKKYTYTITVKASGLTLTTTVADWTDGTSSLSDGGVGNATLTL